MTDSDKNTSQKLRSEELLGFQLKRASSAMMAAFTQKISDLGLTPVTATVLTSIERAHTISQSELGKELGIKRSNVTALLSELEDKKIIEKKRLDGRSYSVSLTQEGKKLTQETKERMLKHEAEFFALFSKEEANMLLGLLSRFWTNPHP